MADGRAKIADMGMSRCQVSEALVTAQAIMTPIWSAPEVSSGGAQSDSLKDFAAFVPHILLW